MTKQTKSSGFTIVELLIVIVVIAILAAITIVAYNGIQDRANTTANQGVASTLAKKAEAFHTSSPDAKYPANIAGFATVDEAKLDANISANLSNDTADPGDAHPKTVAYKQCDSGRGAQAVYYDLVKKKQVAVGVGSGASGVVGGGTGEIAICS